MTELIIALAISLVGVAIMFFMVGFYAGYSFANREWEDAAYQRGWWPPRDKND